MKERTVRAQHLAGIDLLIKKSLALLDAGGEAIVFGLVDLGLDSVASKARRRLGLLLLGAGLTALVSPQIAAEVDVGAAAVVEVDGVGWDRGLMSAKSDGPTWAMGARAGRRPRCFLGGRQSHLRVLGLPYRLLRPRRMRLMPSRRWMSAPFLQRAKGRESLALRDASAMDKEGGAAETGESVGVRLIQSLRGVLKKLARAFNRS